MGYIWDIYGIYMGYIWDIYGAVLVDILLIISPPILNNINDSPWAR